MTSSGKLYQQDRLVPRTYEIDGLESAYPTPTTKGYRASEGEVKIMRKQVEMGNITEMEAESMLGGSLRPPRMEKWSKKDQQESSMKNLRLNSGWVARLMGYPDGWLD